MKTISMIFLLFSIILLSSCSKDDVENTTNEEMYTEASQGGGAGVPEKTQQGSR